MNTSDDSDEKRRLKRFPVKLKVHSQKTDQFIGHARNLHAEGMMILTKMPLPDDQEIQFWLGATKDEKRLNRIFLSAHKVWASDSGDGQNFYSGLSFIKPSESTLEQINALLEELNS